MGGDNSPTYINVEENDQYVELHGMQSKQGKMHIENKIINWKT